jgi:hypothetical protein
MNIKPSAWMKELPTGEGVERAVRTTTVKEVADDWEQATPLYTADDLRSVVLAEREACAKVCEEQQNIFASPRYATGQPMSSIRERFAAGQCAAAIRARGDT